MKFYINELYKSNLLYFIKYIWHPAINQGLKGNGTSLILRPLPFATLRQALFFYAFFSLHSLAEARLCRVVVEEWKGGRGRKIVTKLKDTLLLDYCNPFKYSYISHAYLDTLVKRALDNKGTMMKKAKSEVSLD